MLRDEAMSLSDNVCIIYGTTFDQSALAAVGGVAVVVQFADIDHYEQVLHNLHVHLRHLCVVVETIGEVGHELVLESEACAVAIALLVVVHHVTEVAPLHEDHPLRQLARLLQRLAALHHAPFPCSMQYSHR